MRSRSTRQAIRQRQDDQGRDVDAGAGYRCHSCRRFDRYKLVERAFCVPALALAPVHARPVAEAPGSAKALHETLEERPFRRLLDDPLGLAFLALCHGAADALAAIVELADAHARRRCSCPSLRHRFSRCRAFAGGPTCERPRVQRLFGMRRSRPQFDPRLLHEAMVASTPIQLRADPPASRQREARRLHTAGFV